MLLRRRPPTLQCHSGRPSTDRILSFHVRAGVQLDDCYPQIARVLLLWSFPPPLEPALLCVHTLGRLPHPIALKTNGTFCSLGVENPINPGDSTSLSLMKKKLVKSPRAISTKKASARAVNTVIAKCLYNRGAYVGVLSAWSLQECEDLDRVFAPEIRRRTKKLLSSQTENSYQPASVRGQGYQRISVCSHSSPQTLLPQPRFVELGGHLDALGDGRPPSQGASTVTYRSFLGHHPSRCTSWLLCF